MNKYDDLTTLTIDELLDRYVSDALEHDRHRSVLGRTERNLWETSTVACNVAVGRMGAVYCELRRRGRDAQERILDLLDHPEERVRGWARVHAMDFVPERFIPELENEAAQEGLGAWGARSALKELREGTRKPYPDKRYRSKPTVTEAERWPPVSPDVADILGVTNNRLDSETPALGAAFRRVPLDKRRAFAVQVTELAINENVIDADEVQDAEYALRFEKLPALEEHEKMTALATRLDDEARRQVPPDRDRWKERNAHAVRALAIALTGDSTRLDEVVHEAIASQQEPESFVQLLLERLRGDPNKPRPAKNPFGA